MQQVFTSWSGGKDSCLACYQAVRSGLQVCYLLNMISEDGKRSRSHGLSAKVLRLQSQALEIPLVQRRATWDNYEAEFRNALRLFKEKGVEGGVFGDIDFNEHREWVDRICQQADITPRLPLWGLSQEKILMDFIGLGFEAIVVATKADLLGEEWLGRRIDLKFLELLDELGKTKEITPCGEAGEYHTLVIDGPLFKQRMEILEANKVLRDGHWFLEILKSELRPK
ncbi:diphthine--ammonia ligase [Chloroflexota bacterium]